MIGSLFLTQKIDTFFSRNSLNIAFLHLRRCKLSNDRKNIENIVSMKWYYKKEILIYIILILTSVLISVTTLVCRRNYVYEGFEHSSLFSKDGKNFKFDPPKFCIYFLCMAMVTLPIEQVAEIGYSKHTYSISKNWRQEAWIKMGELLIDLQFTYMRQETVT